MLQQPNFFFQHSFLPRRKSIQKKKNMCGKALGYNGKAKEKKCAKKKACGKALVDNGKAKEKKCAKKKACGKALVDNGKEPIVTRAGSFEEQH
jgi:hypothetical protein